MSRPMRVAIVHDDLTQRGGAERVVLSLSRLFPDAPIFTGVYDATGTFPEFGARDVRTTALQRLPHRGRAARALLPLYPWAFGRLRLRGYDLVVSSSTRFAHGVDGGEALHLCYCHAPARFLYQADRYLAPGGPVPRTLRPAVRALLPALRRWDQAAARRPTAYVANSRHVARRIDELYGRDATVVHPPVDVPRFADAGDPRQREGHLLVVSRLLPYKNVDLVVKACTATDRPLVVVGDGPMAGELRRIAGPTVTFERGVDDARLLELVARSRAVVQAGEEDFGIVPVEANAAGRPVVALGHGGALETVVDGVTGVLFREPTVDALVGALARLEGTSFDPHRLREHALSFDETRFHERLLATIDQMVASRQLVAPFTPRRS